MRASDPRPVAIWALCTLLASTAVAIEPTGEAKRGEESEIAREITNPLRRIWVLSNQFDNFFFHGDLSPDIRYINAWLFQPVLPIPLPNNWMIVNRPILQTIFHAELPRPSPTGVSFVDRTWELGDLPYVILCGKLIRTKLPLFGSGDFALGVGPTFLFPVATVDELGTGKYSMGPGAAAAFIGENATLGFLYQHWFSFAGDSDRGPVNLLNLQVFYFLNFPGGWQLGGTPIITANFEQPEGSRWNVPLGIGGFATFFVGPLPIRLGVEYQWSFVFEDLYGARWNIRILFAPVIPSLISWPWQ